MIVKPLSIKVHTKTRVKVAQCIIFVRTKQIKLILFELYCISCYQSSGWNNTDWIIEFFHVYN